MKKVGVGIIGVGGIGIRHAQVLSKTPEAKLLGIAELDPKRLQIAKEKYGVKIATDNYQDLLIDDEIDAIYILTPPHIRKKIVKDVVASGKAIFIEKPLANNVEDSVEIIEMIESSNAVSTIGLMERRNYALREIHDIVQSGGLGKISLVRHSAHLPRNKPSKTWLFNSAQGGGASLESSVHTWDFIRWITGDEYERVYCEGDWREGDGYSYDAAFAAVGKFVSGATFMVNHTFDLPDCAGLDVRLDIVGTKGTVGFDLSRDPVNIFTDEIIDWGQAGVTGKRPLGIAHSSPHIGAYWAETVSFLDAVRSGTPHSPNVRDGLPSIKMAIAVLQAMKTGKIIQLRD